MRIATPSAPKGVRSVLIGAKNTVTGPSPVIVSTGAAPSQETKNKLRVEAGRAPIRNFSAASPTKGF